MRNLDYYYLIFQGLQSKRLDILFIPSVKLRYFLGYNHTTHRARKYLYSNYNYSAGIFIGRENYINKLLYLIIHNG